MMKNLGFRVWNSEGREYFSDWDSGNYGGVTFYDDCTIAHYLDLTCHCSPEGCGGCADIEQSHKLSCEDIIEQKTGLKDELGVDVYCGDIIELKTGERVVIEYSDDDFCHIGWVKSTQEYQPIRFFHLYKKFKVVGNIHENPELIKGVVSDGE